MKAIHKYSLEVGHNAVEMPEGAQVLTVQEQGGRMQMWALVNPEVTRKVERTFMAYGTGEEVPSNPGAYVATVQLGWTVWHVFEDSAA